MNAPKNPHAAPRDLDTERGYLGSCLIVENVATVPLHLYQRLPEGGKERARGVPLYRLLNQQPNGWQCDTSINRLLHHTGD